MGHAAVDREAAILADVAKLLREGCNFPDPSKALVVECFGEFDCGGGVT